MIENFNPVYLTPVNYTTFTTEDPRSYSIFVLYTTYTRRKECVVCRQALHNFYHIIWTYQHYYPSSRQLFFAYANYEDCEEICIKV